MAKDGPAEWRWLDSNALKRLQEIENDHPAIVACRDVVMAHLDNRLSRQIKDKPPWVRYGAGRVIQTSLFAIKLIVLHVDRPDPKGARVARS